MSSEGFHDEAGNVLQVLLDFYAPHFTITPGFELAGTRLNALAEYHNRAEKTLFGMKLKTEGTEANEYGMYLLVEKFTPEALEQAKQLIATAEAQLVKRHPAHGSSLISLIILTGHIFEGADRLLKKVKQWKEYSQQGWSMARIAVMDVNSRSIICNNDGKDLRRLMQNALAGKTLL